MAHITGGGLTENILRSLQNLSADISLASWELPEIFKYKESSIASDDLLRFLIVYWYGTYC